uniref:BGL24 n=1 Tax=Arundo donax TaxID=35708 RepID=A0A0A9A5C2_ARUDO
MNHPYINSNARLAASLSCLEFEYGIIQLLTIVIPIFPFCSAWYLSLYT